MRIIYLRDDDVYKKDKEFTELFNWMIKEKIKCSYSVIPAKITSEIINFFDSFKEYKKYFDIVQHGYSHKENKKRTEFGMGVYKKYQMIKIKKGFDELKLKCFDFFSPVYVPPFHNYDVNTVKVCEKNGFKAISASRKIYDENIYKIKFLYCDINLNEYHNRNPLPIDTGFAKRLTLEKIKKRKIIGVYFHHITFSKHNNMERFIEYIEFVKKLEKKGIVKIKKISDII